MVQNDKPIVKFLNIMVLLSSILVLVIISIELLSATTILSERFILNTHLMVCTIFLADFFVRWYFSQEGWHFLGHHIFLLLISIPYLNIVYISSAHLSHATWVLLRLIPIARGIYGISIIVSWMTRSKVTNLFVTYLVHRLCHLIFAASCSTSSKHGPNPMVKELLGCLQLVIDERHYRRFHIFGVTKLGQSLAVILAASGMVFFPIFTAFVVDNFQKKRKEAETPTHN